MTVTHGAVLPVSAAFHPLEYVVQSAWLEHGPFALWLADALRPERFVELGTHNGFSFFAFCQGFAAAGIRPACTAIDTWRGDEHAGFYGEEVLRSVRLHAAARYPDLDIALVQSTFDDARARVPDGSVDLLHIDGRHFTEDVRHDWETWKDTLSDRSVAVFHDTAERAGGFGVWAVWEELAEHYPSFSFDHGHGLGILAVGTHVPQPILDLCALRGEDADYVRGLFASIGRGVTSQWDAAARVLETAQLRESMTRAEIRTTRLLHENEITRARLAESLRNAPPGPPAPTRPRLGSTPWRNRLTRQPREAPAEVTRGALRREFTAPELPEALHQVFDADFYGTQVSLERGVDPWDHFCTTGRLAGLSPHPLVDPRWYLDQNSSLSAEGAEPCDHYFRTGWQEGKDPHPLFWSTWYLEQNADVRAARAEPLTHFLEYGAREGRDPNPYFDLAWYDQQYPIGVREYDNPLVDYLLVGGPAGRRPAREFDGEWYQQEYPESAGMDPFLHYVTRGRFDGRPTSPDGLAVGRVTELLTARDLLAQRWAGRRPLPVRPGNAPGRIVVVTDSVGSNSLFGGVATAMILGALLANATSRELRVITRTVPGSASAIDDILRIAGVPRPERVGFDFVPTHSPTAFATTNDDLYLTTSWWSTDDVRGSIDPERIVYLLQEDERMFYPVGDEWLRAQDVMSDPRSPVVVNTGRLYRFLAENGCTNLLDNGTSFEPSFRSFAEISSHRDGATGRHLFFYSRPGGHIRNLFSLGLGTLVAALDRGVLSPGRWTIHMVGSGTPAMTFGKDVNVRIHPQLSWRQYSDLLGRIDLGLSLMSTPHPSYPPLDLVASGAWAVSNTWAGKREAPEYGERLTLAEPTVDALVGALDESIHRLESARPAPETPAILLRSWSETLDPTVQWIRGVTRV